MNLHGKFTLHDISTLPDGARLSLKEQVKTAIISASNRPDVMDYPRTTVGKPIDFDDMSELTDSAVVNDQDNYFLYPPTRHLVIASSTTHLRAAMKEMEDIQGYGIEDEVYDEDCIHESAHAKAALEVGFTNPLIGLRLVGLTHASIPEIPESQVKPAVLFNAFCNMEKPSVPVTKLGYAAICIAPALDTLSDRLSETSDLQLLRRIGYESVDEAAERIRFNNTKTENKPLPLPAHML